MEKRSKSISIGNYAALLLIVMVFLGQTAGCRSYHGEHGGKFGHGRCFEKDFSEHVLERFDSHAEELDLTDKQKESYVQIRLKAKAYMEKNAEKRKAFFEDLRTEMEKENPDVNAAAERVKKGLREFQAAMEEHVGLFMDFYNILDENQKAKVLKGFKKRM